MNMIAPTGLAERRGLAASEAPDDIEIVAAWPVAQGALLLLARASASLPLAGIAQVDRRRADAGPFRAVAWPAPDAAGATGAACCVLAVRLPQTIELRPGAALALTAADGTLVLGRLPDGLASPAGFAAETARLLGAADARAQASVARFLAASFPPAMLPQVPGAGDMLAALLAALAPRDGCIELMGTLPGACGFLQGWGGPVPTADSDGCVLALLVGARVTSWRVRLAGFARPDIAAPAAGAVVLLPEAAAGDLAGLEHLYLLGAHGLARRDPVERRLLDADASRGHVRDMLPALRCAPAVADSLRHALRPRYDGRETLGGQALPVRAAVDLALLLPAEAGRPGIAYLTGWLFDPDGHVAAVTLRGGAGCVRLDAGWTRVPRQDVSEALTAAGLPPPRHHDHGFAVHVECPAGLGGQALHLDIEFQDGACAFVPVAARPADDPAARARALEGTDLHKVSGIPIVENHLGPLTRALMRGTPPKPPAATALPWAWPIVVPLVGAPVPPRGFLSQFLRDALAEDEGVAFVCGAGWGAADLAGLHRLAAFMGVRVAVLPAPGADGALAALDVAAAALPGAAALLLAEAGVVGRAPGWRASLRAAAAGTRGRAAVCPTVLYEDLSLRFAGSATLAVLPAAPYATVRRTLAGMPAALAEAHAPEPAGIGTLACCLLPAAALPVLRAARAGLSTGFGQEVAAFLGLQRAGIACLWAPQAEVFAPDAAALAAAPVARLVDGWCLRALHTES